MRGTTSILTTVLVLGCNSDDAVTGPLPDPVPGPGDFTRVLPFDGRTRSYLLHVPPALEDGTPLPLVLAFHGVPSSGGEMRSITGFDALADRLGFAVAYPDAVEDWWTGCADCGSRAFLLDIDDVGFVRRLIEQLATDVPIDPRRVYAAGFSNGALFVHRLACDAADRIAAFASVAATALDPAEVPPCRPGRQVSILFFHGSADPSFPPEGRTFGEGPSAVSTLPIAETVSVWATVSDCQTTPQRTPLPDRELDGTTVVREQFEGCAQNVEVVYYAIEGGGHTWPGSPVDFASFLGPKSRDVIASEVIAEFFLDHRL